MEQYSALNLGGIYMPAEMTYNVQAAGHGKIYKDQEKCYH